MVKIVFINLISMEIVITITTLINLIMRQTELLEKPIFQSGESVIFTYYINKTHWGDSYLILTHKYVVRINLCGEFDN